MSNRTFAHNLRRKQLDRCFADLALLRQIPVPRVGWIREIRSVLGMSAAQLARRVGVGQSTVAKMEKTEVEDTISLQSLRKMAVAMDCTLVYAFVPNTSLESIVEQQARRRATQLVMQVEHTMALEDQSTMTELRDSQISELADELKRNLSRELWEDRN